MPTNTNRLWTRTDMATFRSLAKQHLSGAQIAKKLKRSIGATYQQASAAGIRINSNGVRRRKRRA